MAIDINRGTSGVSLPKEVSTEIWSKVLENSAVMNLARRIELPGRGLEVQTITGEPTAAWVNETDEKTVSKHTLATKTITPYTIAVIVPFSNQFRRDKRALYEELVRRLPSALAKTFDNTAFGGTTKPGDNFDQLSGCSAFGIKSIPVPLPASQLNPMIMDKVKLPRELLTYMYSRCLYDQKYYDKDLVCGEQRYYSEFKKVFFEYAAKRMKYS